MFGSSQSKSGPSGQGWGNSTGFSGFNTGASTTNNPSNTSNSSNPSTGLFGSGTSTGSNSLFGNSSNTQPKPSLFGNSTNTSTFNQGTSNLFSNNSNNNNNNSNNTNSLNGGISQQSKQAYVPNSVFQGIPTNYEMPESITGSLFANEGSDKNLSSKRSPVANSSSIFSKVASKLNIFKNTNIPNQINGIFASTDFPSTKPAAVKSAKPSTHSTKNRISKPSALSLIEARSTNETKKLIIKSKPLKFHMINADKVLNAKRKRVLPSLVLSDKLLNDDPSDDDSDFDSTANESAAKNHSKIMKGISEEPSLTATSTNSSISKTELRQGQYWSSPSIETLTEFSLKDLSNIDNFIIGRKGFGQIAFNLPVDLSDVKRNCLEQDKPLEEELFFETVEIGLKFVRVYKDNDSKPPRGFGMNVPATITLENIKPNEGKNLRSFIQMLKQKEGMEFLTYDPIMFKWTFKVEHFSIWGLADEDDSNRPKNDLSLSDEEYLKELKRQKISNETKDLPGNWGTGNPSESILTFKRNLLDNEIDSQINLYKDESENHPDGQPNNVLSGDNMPVDEEDERSSVRPTNNFEYLKQLVSVLPTNVNLQDIVQERAYEPEINNESAFNSIQPRPNIAISDDWLVQLKLTNDLNSSLAEYLSNPGPKIQEQGKLKFESIDDILFHNFNQSAESSSKEVSTPLIKAVEGEEDRVDEDVFMTSSSSNTLTQVAKDITGFFPKLLDQSNFEPRPNGGFFKVTKSQYRFCEFALNSLMSEKLHRILSLCSVLFDKIEVESAGDIFASVSTTSDIVMTDISSYLESLEQRKAFVQWLKEFNEPKVRELLSAAGDNSLQKIFIHICAGNINEAIKLAIDSHNNHLSVLLSLVDSNYQGFRNVAKSQLLEWLNNDYIPQDLIRIYKLFAGELDEVLQDYPWSIILSCKTFLGDVDGTTLALLISSVVEKLEVRDEFMDVMMFYCILTTEGLDKAVTYLNSTKTENALRWFIYKVMGADIDDNLTLRFGRPVEQLGLWKESLFIYAHLVNDVIAEKSIRKVINDHIKEIKDDRANVDEESYLVNTLKIPYGLIYESMATKLNSAKDYWRACEGFITAKLWDKAHECIIHELGPATVISKNKTHIKRLRRIFSQLPMGGKGIATWSSGGGVFENYFTILPYIKDLSLPSDKVSMIESLLENIPLLPLDGSLVAKAAVCIMSKDVGDLALGLGIPNASKKIYDLPLGEAEVTYFNGRVV